MSEALLEALMQLFALLTDIRKESKTGKARFLVEDFLSRQFNSEYVQKYLGRFDVYLNRYHSHIYSDNQALIEKQANDNYSRIHNISSKINAELEQEPKIIIFVQLLDFLKKDEEIGEEEESFVDLLAKQFRIEESDYRNLKHFILSSPVEVPDKSAVMLISGQNESPHPAIKILYNPKQQVFVWVIHVRSTNSFFFRYSGQRNL